MISPAPVLSRIKPLLAASASAVGMGQRVCVVQAKQHIHSPNRRLDFVHAGAPTPPSASGCSPPGEALKIVKSNPGTDIGHAPRGRWRRLSDAPLHTLDRAPRPFDEDVVHEAAGPSIEIATPAAASLPAKASKRIPDRYSISAAFRPEAAEAVHAPPRADPPTPVVGPWPPTGSGGPRASCSRDQYASTPILDSLPASPQRCLRPKVSCLNLYPAAA